MDLSEISAVPYQKKVPGVRYYVYWKISKKE